MSELQLKWERFRFNLSDIKITTNRELQHKNDKGEWERREPNPFAYISYDVKDTEQYNELYEGKEELQFVRGQRLIVASAENDLWNWQIFDGIPADGSPYSIDGLREITRFYVNIYEEVTTPNLVESKNGWFLREEEGHAIWQFSLPPKEFDEVVDLLLQEDASSYIQCSMKALAGLVEGGGPRCFFDPESKKHSPAELFNICTTKTITKSVVAADLEEDPELETYSQGEQLLFQWLAILNQGLDNLDQRTVSMRVAAWITAIGVVAVSVTQLL